KSQISVMSAILEKEPEPISQVQPLTPAALDHVIQRALAKDPDERWQSATDLKQELKWVVAAGSSAVAAAPAVPRPRDRRVWGVGGCCLRRSVPRCSSCTDRRRRRWKSERRSPGPRRRISFS